MTAQQINCRNCQQPLTVGLELRGRKVKCPKCDLVFTIPGEAAQTAPDPDFGGSLELLKPFATFDTRSGGSSAGRGSPTSLSPASRPRKVSNSQAFDPLALFLANWLGMFILVMAVLTLVISLALPAEIRTVGIRQFLIGIAVFCLTFLPRLNTVHHSMAFAQKALENYGKALAAAGGLSTFAVLALIAKFSLRAFNKTNAAFDRGVLARLPPGTEVADVVLQLMISTAIVGTILILFLALWHAIGVVRILASLYLLQLSVFLAFVMAGLLWIER